MVIATANQKNPFVELAALIVAIVAAYGALVSLGGRRSLSPRPACM